MEKPSPAGEKTTGSEEGVVTAKCSDAGSLRSSEEGESKVGVTGRSGDEK